MAPSSSSPFLTPCRIISLVLCTSLILLFTFQNQIISSIQNLQAPCSCHTRSAQSITTQTSTASLTSSPPPSLPKIDRTFREMKILEDLSPGADESWSSILSTPKGGFLWVKYDEGSNEAWGVSMFHAIHCLTMLRNTFQQLTNSTVGGVHHEHGNGHQIHGKRGGQSTADKHMHDPQDLVHIGHCFSYISQYVMCAADSTIEPPWLTYDKDGKLIDFGIDGEGYPHQCRNPSLLWDTVLRSEKEPVEPWRWQTGDTVESVFRR